MEDVFKSRAQQYIRGVYGTDPSVVDALAGDEIVCSYPVFQKLFDVPALQGRKAVKAFASGFRERWQEAKTTFHETLAEGNQVVLLWSFQARRAVTNQEHHWGGITLIRFDASGKIVAEIGEESDPGPAARWRGLDQKRGKQ